MQMKEHTNEFNSDFKFQTGLAVVLKARHGLLQKQSKTSKHWSSLHCRTCRFLKPQKVIQSKAVSDLAPLPFV